MCNVTVVDLCKLFRSTFEQSLWKMVLYKCNIINIIIIIVIIIIIIIIWTSNVSLYISVALLAAFYSIVVT